MSDWVHKITDVASSIGDFFVTLWNDDDRWWYIGGLVVVLIFIYKIIIHPMISLFSGGRASSYSHSRSGEYRSSVADDNKRTVIIKGVYQMNGPKPFTREMKVSSSRIGYYTQLMGNKQKQAQWIRSHFPGADTDRGFSMSVNIK